MRCVMEPRLFPARGCRLMELIPARETLDFLSKIAPRAWIKRMLLWMIFTDELAPYFLEGRSVARTRMIAIITEALESETFGERREELIREQFDPEMAEQLIKADPMEEYREVAYDWPITDGPQHVASGYFVYAKRINWEIGTVEASVFYKDTCDDDLFWDSDKFFTSELHEPDYEVTLKGLCFHRDHIEILQPNIELSQEAKDHRDERPQIGRPRIWNWDGAITHLLTIAQKPDGLPVGPGAQAQIERIVADWFMTTTGNSPSVSQVRQHVAHIVKALKRPESR